MFVIYFGILQDHEEGTGWGREYSFKADLCQICSGTTELFLYALSNSEILFSWWKKVSIFYFLLLWFVHRTSRVMLYFPAHREKSPWPGFNSGLEDLILIFNFVFCKLFLTKAGALNSTLAAAWHCLAVLFCDFWGHRGIKVNKSSGEEKK